MFWLLVIIGLLSLIYLYVIKPMQYWQNLQVPQYSVVKLLRLNLRIVKPNKATSETIKDIYNDFEGHRYFGAYQFIFPTLFLRDPELIKQLTIKDFDHFTDRISVINEESQSLWGKILFLLRGEKWKAMRTILSPTFTGLKLKLMCPLIGDCIKQLLDHLKKDDSETISIEMGEIFHKLACDIIATSAFGIFRNSFEDPNNDFYEMSKRLIDLKSIRLMFIILCPKIAKYFDLQFLDKQVTQYFGKFIFENIKARETKGIVRPDMLQLIVEAKAKAALATDENKTPTNVNDNENNTTKLQLTDDYILSQALVFFFAGYGGVSTALSFLAYELAVNPEVQEKLYEEIRENVNHFGTDPTYENLMKMKYLDMVVSENLRKIPIALSTDRVCTKAYTIQPKHPDEKPLHMKVGDTFSFAVNTIHTDPKYFPNPDRFDPERFSDENKSKIAAGTYIPFGSGPRFCIATKFAQLELKLVFFYLLANYKLVVTEKTPIPYSLSKELLKIEIAGGFWIGLQKRPDSM